jgi:hypothetical protein
MPAIEGSAIGCSKHARTACIHQTKMIDNAPRANERERRLPPPPVGDLLPQPLRMERGTSLVEKLALERGREAAGYRPRQGRVNAAAHWAKSKLAPGDTNGLAHAKVTRKGGAQKQSVYLDSVVQQMRAQVKIADHRETQNRMSEMALRKVQNSRRGARAVTDRTHGSRQCANARRRRDRKQPLKRETRQAKGTTKFGRRTDAHRMNISRATSDR